MLLPRRLVDYNTKCLLVDKYDNMEYLFFLGIELIIDFIERDKSSYFSIDCNATDEKTRIVSQTVLPLLRHEGFYDFGMGLLSYE